MAKAAWVSGGVDWQTRGEGGPAARRLRPPPLDLELTRTNAWFCRSAALVQLLGGLAWAGIYLSGRAIAATTLSVAFALGATTSLAAAVWLHSRRDHDRRVKYNLLLTGQAWLSWAVLLALYPRQREAALTLGVVAAAWLLLLPQAWLVHRWLRADVGATGDEATFRRAAEVYRLTRMAGSGVGLRSAGAFVLARLVDPTGYCFFLLRYFATEKLLREKVLYLRAFQAPHAEALTARAVAPLSESLPIEAWVPEAASMPAGLRVRTVRVDDADWQLWLEQQLRRALAVLVDASKESLMTSYELKLAVQLVPRERIIVLLPEGVREPRSGLGSVMYDAESPTDAAAPLAAWLERVTTAAARGKAAGDHRVIW